MQEQNKNSRLRFFGELLLFIGILVLWFFGILFLSLGLDIMGWKKQLDILDIIVGIFFFSLGMIATAWLIKNVKELKASQEFILHGS